MIPLYYKIDAVDHDYLMKLPSSKSSPISRLEQVTEILDLVKPNQEEPFFSLYSTAPLGKYSGPRWLCIFTAMVLSNTNTLISYNRRFQQRVTWRIWSLLLGGIASPGRSLELDRLWFGAVPKGWEGIQGCQKNEAITEPVYLIRSNN